MVEENSSENLIIDFLKEHRGKKFNIREMWIQINKKTPVSYQTILKYVAVLIAGNKIQCKDYGVVKIIWVD